MKRKTGPYLAFKKIAAVVTALTLTVSVSACAGHDKTTPDSYVTFFGSEPQNPLIPTDTGEVGGGEIIKNLFSGLVDYDTDGNTHNLVAQSIEGNANSTEFTVKIAPNWKFTNGETITSDSFIDAWNFGANSKNAQLNADFFSNIAGYAELADGKADGLAGLKKINDSTFKVTLNNPEATWPDRLGHQAFAPLPQVAFEDMDAFGQAPIGNGPYMLESPESWVHNVNINLKTNPNYLGENKPKNDGISFVFYTSLETAYADLQAGDLDSMRESVSPNAFPSFRADFPKSSSADPMAAIETIAIPFSVEHFGQNEEGRLRRHAISLAIDRELITKKLYFDARVPARDFGSYSLGDTSRIKGSEVLSFDQQKARDLWAKADKISPYGGETFQISYNADGGHQQWVEAVANSVRQTLDIPAQGKSYPNFKGLRDDVVNGQIGGAYRSAWGADYPSISHFLEAPYRTGGSSNDTGYSNPKFDSKLIEAASQSDIEDANKVYNEAQAFLLQDLPQIPLWYKLASTAWNPELKNVRSAWDGMPNYTEIEKPTTDNPGAKADAQAQQERN